MIASSRASSRAAHAGGSVDGSATVGRPSRRRRAVGAIARSRAASRDLASATPQIVYVSGYSTTIARYTLDATTGALTAAGTTTATGTPSFLAFDAARRHVYAVDEANSKSKRSRSMRRRARSRTSARRGVGRQRTGASHRRRQRQMAARRQLRLGHVGILPIAATAASARARRCTRARTRTRSCSTAATSSRGSRASAPITSRNTRSTPPTANAERAKRRRRSTTPAGSGPRHLALHPTRALAYLIEETDSMIGGVQRRRRRQAHAAAAAATRASGATGDQHRRRGAGAPVGKLRIRIESRRRRYWRLRRRRRRRADADRAHEDGRSDAPPLLARSRRAGSCSSPIRARATCASSPIDATAGTLTPTGATVAASMPSFVGAVALP